MATSANVVEYRVFDKDGNVVKEYSQHLYCKSKHKEELEKFIPPEDYEIQSYGLDEDEAPWENKKISLRLFLIQMRIIKGLSYAEVRAIASQRDLEFRAGQNFNKVIIVKHCDGSRFEFRHATLEKIDEEWYAIYSEHNGFHVYYIEDIEYIQEVERKFVYYSNQNT